MAVHFVSQTGIEGALLRLRLPGAPMFEAYGRPWQISRLIGVGSGYARHIYRYETDGVPVHFLVRFADVLVPQVIYGELWDTVLDLRDQILPSLLLPN